MAEPSEHVGRNRRIGLALLLAGLALVTWVTATAPPPICPLPAAAF